MEWEEVREEFRAVRSRRRWEVSESLAEPDWREEDDRRS